MIDVNEYAQNMRNDLARRREMTEREHFLIDRFYDRGCIGWEPVSRRQFPDPKFFNTSNKKEEDDSSESSSSNDSCCYVTTACLDAMSLPRDSQIMAAMKTLTRDYILKSFKGKKDYLQYRKRGPVIVQAIKSREDSHVIWNNVYKRLEEVTSNILSGDYAGSHKQYRSLMLELENQFVLSFNQNSGGQKK